MKMNSIFLSVFLSVLAFGLTTNVFASNAHKYHTSLTRIDYNEKDKTAEITIRLFIRDLVPVLEKFAGKRIELERTPDIDKIILSYLNQNFIFKDGSGVDRNLIWVGKELEAESAYVHIQVPLPGGLQSASLQNTIFFESFPQQTNRVVSRYNGKKSNLVFVRGDKFKQISFETSRQVALIYLTHLRT